MTLLVKSLACVLLIFGIVYCIKLVPERVSILHVNKEEIEWIKFYVKRYGRKSAYYLNLEGNVLKPWGNNVTVHLIFYEYLHNEYRRSFVEMHFKLCDLLEKEVYLGSMFKMLGARCPVFGEYHLMNMTVPLENFPYKVPFEKARIDGFLNTTNTNVMILWSQIYVHFGNK